MSTKTIASNVTNLVANETSLLVKSDLAELVAAVLLVDQQLYWIDHHACQQTSVDALLDIVQPIRQSVLASFLLEIKPDLEHVLMYCSRTNSITRLSKS